MQKNSAVEDPKKDDLYEVGVIASIEKTVIGEKGEINALVKGIEKVKIVEKHRKEAEDLLNLAKCYYEDAKHFEKKGDLVNRGDLIGYVGSTGYATGPHLHLEVWLDGQARNPLAYLVS